MLSGFFLCLFYCNAISHGLPQSSIANLQHIQNMAARLLMGTKKLNHLSTVLRSWSWLPSEKKSHFKVVHLVSHALQNHSPGDMRDIFQEGTNVWTSHFTVSSQLAIPKSRFKGFGDHVFSISFEVCGMLYQDLSLLVNLLVLLRKKSWDNFV